MDDDNYELSVVTESLESLDGSSKWRSAQLQLRKNGFVESSINLEEIIEALEWLKND